MNAEHETYLSTSEGKWRVIHQGVPLCVDKATREECAAVLKSFRLTATAVWDGDAGQFIPVEVSQ